MRIIARSVAGRKGNAPNEIFMAINHDEESEFLDSWGLAFGRGLSNRNLTFGFNFTVA